MDVWSLLFIIIFQLLNLAKAAWNPNSAIILVDIPGHTPKMFPPEVRIHQESNRILYFDIRFQNSETAYPYCPLVNTVENCNFVMEPITLYNYTPGAPFPLVHTCDFPVVYSLEQNPGPSEQYNCAYNNKEGKRYRFIYLLCELREDEVDVQESLPIFEMCYQDDPQLMQIIIGSYEIENPNLLGNALLSDERDHPFEFNRLPDPFNHFGHFYYLYQQNHQYLPRAVVPPELLPFANQRRPLYHFTNTAPMLSVLKPGWDLFMRKLRDKVSRLNYKVHVIGGLLDIELNAHYGDMHLGLSENGRPMVKIPRHWWVLIHKPGFTEGIAIFMHNQVYQVNAEGRPNMDVYHLQSCSKKRCDNIGNVMLDENDYPFNFIYCCAMRLITRKFGLTSSHTGRILRFPNALT